MSSILSAYMHMSHVCAWSFLPLPPLSFQRPEKTTLDPPPPPQEMKLHISVGHHMGAGN